MSRPRKRRYSRPEESSHNSERWLVTYSDLITLLLVFFIVMYSMSSIENQKFNALVSSLKSSFQGDSILQGMGYPSTDKGQTKPTVPLVKKAQPISNQEKKKDEKKLDALYVQLDKYIKDNHLSPDVSLVETARGVQLTFREKILFDLGKANLKPNAKSVLGKIGNILKSVPNDISIEGHTDNTPFRNQESAIHSNWELSGLRAQTVMNYLINKDELLPKRMHFVGYGEYQPIVKNDTPEHKAMNRRVNIVVIREGNKLDSE
ncbi:OmpA/MotB family protein [Sporolactobacillus laevolacticus]|uniref:Flagellar motor protein MotB n=1 Tax=Sporolactobacillus laevolacticus DSM 442 TaxID=1395513 RepID=V6IUM0_9BACL|nr:flagellar motor protein MotB [Sporolactobacillus laevolacticus]EST10680.1 flagellar motor protein MotB [Sporolactobacillus laevolacticus DSM 442]MDN3956555.1 flagellar motor protein MotB [Sporolactobacillus laevolacticus]